MNYSHLFVQTFASYICKRNPIEVSIYIAVSNAVLCEIFNHTLLKKTFIFTKKKEKKKRKEC